MAAFESMMSAFNTLPYMNPMMQVNVSDTSIVRKVIQAKMFGSYSLDISRKMESPWSESTMLVEEDWNARRDAYRQLAQYLSNNAAEEHWYPLLYDWEIHPCDVNAHFEYGHIVFVNGKLNKFLLVNAYGPDPFDTCGKGHIQISYLDALKTQANLVCCFMKYAGFNIAWVRATYTSLQARAVSSTFLADREVALLNATATYSPIVHITETSYVPCLTALQIKCIDGLIRAAKMPVPTTDRVLVSLPASSTKASLGFQMYGMDREAKEYWRNLYAKECAGCRNTFTTLKLKRCGSCGMQQYCSTECQKKQWPHHKAFCKSTQLVA